MAIALGRTKWELLDSLNSRQLTELLAFYDLEPFGDRAAQFMIAQITALWFSAHKGQEQQALGADAFLPGERRQPKQQQSAQDMLDRLTRMNR